MLKILYLKFLLRIEIKIFFFLLKNDKTYLDLVFISSVKMYVFYNTVSLCAFWPKFHYVLYTCRVHSAGMNHAFLSSPFEPKNNWNITACVVHSYQGPSHFCLCYRLLLVCRERNRLGEGWSVSFVIFQLSRAPSFFHIMKLESPWIIFSQSNSIDALVGRSSFPSTHFYYIVC